MEWDNNIGVDASQDSNQSSQDSSTNPATSSTPPFFIWNYKCLQLLNSVDEKELIMCLMRSGVIKKPPCAKCGQIMRLKFRHLRSHAWICRKRGKDCSSSSLKSSTIFSNSHTKMADQISITVAWLNGQKYTDCPKLPVHKKLIYEQLEQLRFECIRYWKSVKVGGPDVVVQLKAFYLKGMNFLDSCNTSDDHIMLILIERKEYGRVYVELVNNTAPETIGRIIKDRLIVGSYLVCDEWRNYLVGGLNPDLFSNAGNMEIREVIGDFNFGDEMEENETNTEFIFEMNEEEKIEEKDPDEVDFMKISDQLFGNGRAKMNLISMKDEEEEASIAEEIKESTSELANPDFSIETPDEFFEFMMMRFEQIWKVMTVSEREEVIGESVMRFNGRRDPHKLFWKILIQKQRNVV